MNTRYQLFGLWSGIAFFFLFWLACVSLSIAVLAQSLARIEGGAGVLTYAALLGGAGTMVLTFYPAIWWLVAAFRPERSQDLV